MTHTFIVDIAHRLSSTWAFSINHLRMNEEYEEFMRELGKDINDPFNFPLCSYNDKMYSALYAVFCTVDQ